MHTRREAEYRLICNSDFSGEIEVTHVVDSDDGETYRITLDAAFAVVAAWKRQRIMSLVEDMSTEDLFVARLTVG